MAPTECEKGKPRSGRRELVLLYPQTRDGDIEMSPQPTAAIVAIEVQFIALSGMGLGRSVVREGGF